MNQSKRLTSFLAMNRENVTYFFDENSRALEFIITNFSELKIINLERSYGVFTLGIYYPRSR